MAEKRKYADRREYLIRAVVKRRRKLKQLSVEYLDGKCVICGYSRTPAALDIHHRDPDRKDFSLSTKGLTRSWARIKEELEKCVLLCANCHREVHAGIAQLPGVIQVEKRGEFGETQKGNPEPSSER